MDRTRVETTVDDFAKYLAWADRASDIFRPEDFRKNADRYWGMIDTQWKGKWLNLAAKLLGVERRTFLDDVAVIKAALAGELRGDEIDSEKIMGAIAEARARNVEPSIRSLLKEVRTREPQPLGSDVAE